MYRVRTGRSRIDHKPSEKTSKVIKSEILKIAVSESWCTDSSYPRRPTKNVHE